MKLLFLSLITISFSVRAMEKVASKQEKQIARQIVCISLNDKTTYTLTALQNLYKSIQVMV